MSDDDPDAVPYSECGVQELVVRYGDAARAMVMRRGFDQPEAEAVVQEAYIAVLKTWQQRGCLVKPHLLLFATVRRKMADEFRRQNRKPANLVENSEDIAETAKILWQTQFAGKLIKKLDVANALLDLPERQRAVLVLRFMDDLEITVVAELLGCTPNDVKYAQRTGLDSMRTSEWLAGHTGTAEVHQ